MTCEFLMLANTVLVARLIILFRDEPVHGRTWLFKALIEPAALFVLYGFSWTALAAASVMTAVNVSSWRWEKRAQRRSLGRLLFGLVELVALSVVLAPAFTEPGFHLQFAWSGPPLGELTVFAPLIRAATSYASQLALFGLLLAANEANLGIRAVFDSLDLKPRMPSGGGEAAVDIGEFNRGRVIGMLERALLYVFILQGQYGAIGFILAAKAFARFKALDDRPFAEYVLIGTLLSASCALMAGGVVQLLSLD